MEITLQPACLRWARERARLSIPELASKLGLKEDRIIAWEQSGEITLSRAERLAKATHIPFGYLFLPAPINEALPIRDFRTVEPHDILQPSVDLLDVVNDALQRQAWYRDYMLAIGGEPVAFVGSLSLSDDLHTAAEHIRSAIGWNLIHTQSSSWEQALAARIQLMEDAGILVMRSGVVGINTHRPLSVSEFRGFALSDDYAPLIFINSKDARAAQMFTLVHELVHIGLGVSGISNLNRTYSPDTTIERFCNAVAAELLVPLGELKTLWADIKSAPDRITRAARHFKVSSLVILRRLRDAQSLTSNEFERLYTDELIHFRQKSGEQSGGGDFYTTLRSRFGSRFLAAVIENTLDGQTPYREAFQLLGVNNAEIVHKLAESIGMMA